MTTVKDVLRTSFEFVNNLWWIPLTWILDVIYVVVQKWIIFPFFQPPFPPRDGLSKPYGKIAVIGAGLTGVSSAAHCMSHNFEVTIFEKNSRSRGLGGIWSNVNKTSGLQINSVMYRFHPAVFWKRSLPQAEEITAEIRKIWKNYNLESRTNFNTPVTSVKRAPAELFEDSSDPDRSRWIINGDESTYYDGVIVNLGTCGQPSYPPWAKEVLESRSSTPGDGKHTQQNKPIIIHSSDLDDLDEDVLKDMKRIVVVGSGASGVEGIEWVMEHISLSKSGSPPEVLMLARTDKWIIPRNVFIDTLISLQPFGREMPLSFLWEGFLKFFHYFGAEDLVPDDGKGLFHGTPIVNDTFIDHVRTGRCKYLRGNPVSFSDDGKGIVFQERERGQFDEKKWDEKVIGADLIVLATGFKKPDVDFFEDMESVFPEDYSRPDLYLQNFSTEDWSVLMTNASYVNAIGTVGHIHIGMYARILLTFIMDSGARPAKKDMKLWVDIIRWIKRGAEGGALAFFTYAELTIWLVTFHLFRPDRLKWFFFIMVGWGVHAK